MCDLLKSGYTQISVSTFHIVVHKAPLHPPIADFITLSPAPLWPLSWGDGYKYLQKQPQQWSRLEISVILP